MRGASAATLSNWSRSSSSENVLYAELLRLCDANMMRQAVVKKKSKAGRDVESSMRILLVRDKGGDPNGRRAVERGSSGMAQEGERSKTTQQVTATVCGRARKGTEGKEGRAEGKGSRDAATEPRSRLPPPTTYLPRPGKGRWDAGANPNPNPNPNAVGGKNETIHGIRAGNHSCFLT